MRISGRCKCAPVARQAQPRAPRGKSSRSSTSTDPYPRPPRPCSRRTRTRSARSWRLARPRSWGPSVAPQRGQNRQSSSGSRGESCRITRALALAHSDPLDGVVGPLDQDQVGPLSRRQDVRSEVGSCMRALMLRRNDLGEPLTCSSPPHDVAQLRYRERRLEIPERPRVSSPQRRHRTGRSAPHDRASSRSSRASRRLLRAQR